MATPVSAQKTDGAFRLSLDGIVYAGEFGTFTAPEDPELGTVELETTNTNAGLYAGSLGVGLAYAFSRNGVIGARLLHSESTSNVAGDAAPAAKSTRFTLLPSAEYVGTASPTVQPFVAGIIGFQIGSTEAGEAETSTSAFLFGVSAGLHMFPTDTFSIDPYLAYYRAGGSASTGSIDVDYAANTVLLGFSISGWIGGSGAGAPAEPTPAVEAAVESRDYEPAATPGPSPSPAARLKLVEDDDLLTGVIALTSGQLTLLSRPTVDAENITVRVTVTGGDSKFESCRTGALLAGDGRFALRDMSGRTKQHGSQTIAVLQGNVGSRELSTFTEAEDARIVLCGRIFAVHAAPREGIGQYFEHFRELAIEAKTWDKPAAPSGTESPPSDTEAAPPAGQPPSAPSSPATPGTAPAPAATPAPAKAAPSPPSATPPTGSFGAP